MIYILKIDIFFLTEYKCESEIESFNQEIVTISFQVPSDKSKGAFKLGQSFSVEMEVGVYKFRLSCPESVHIIPKNRVTDSITIIFKKVERLGEQKMNNRAESFLHELFDEDANKRESAHILTPKISNIYANEKKKTIVVKWQTGETTKVTCIKGDKWDLEKGIMAAITKYVLGNNYNAGNIVNKYIKSVKETN